MLRRNSKFFFSFFFFQLENDFAQKSFGQYVESSEKKQKRPQPPSLLALIVHSDCLISSLVSVVIRICSLLKKLLGFHAECNIYKYEVIPG